MSDWLLTFRLAKPMTRDEIAAVVKPSKTEENEFSGNPRDGFARNVTMTIDGGLVRILEMTQVLPDPDPVSSIEIKLTGAYAEKLAMWQSLRDTVPGSDETLGERPGDIIDDIEAAGDSELLKLLRSQITAALIARARGDVLLYSTRPDDIEAVLAAYNEFDTTSVSISDCKLTGVPANLARFSNLKVLWIDGAFDGEAFRGLRLPKLEKLGLERSAIRRLTRADLAGFPGLFELWMDGTPLEELEPRAGLRVSVDRTPLARDRDKLNALVDAGVEVIAPAMGQRWDVDGPPGDTSR